MQPAVHRFDLEALEFQVVRELLAERMATPLGRNAAQSLAPLSSVDACTRALRQAKELAGRLLAGEALPTSGISDVRPWLSQFFAGERLPETRELADLKRLLRAACRCKAWLLTDPSLCALAELGGRFPGVQDLADELDTILDDRGEVLSTASQKLATVRQEIEQAEVLVRAAVQRFLANDEVRKYLQSVEPSWRHGRPVFQVRQEHRGRIAGVLHDRSQSGATFFIEPSGVVEAANRLSDAKAAEHREIQVILAHTCRGLRTLRPELEGTLAAIAGLDLAFARARMIASDGFVAAPVRESGPLRILRGRHPILVRRGDHDIVPLDVTLGDPYRMLVITGPNTGGKTVALKTIGLLTLMAMAAVPIPADEGSEFPFLDGVFADIGDEQGISQNLSTFSSHVGRIARCLREAGSTSLVLVDELGAGTDPEEGGALGYATLEELERLRAFAAVTTHLGRLKDFAHQHHGAQNGAMAFDGETLAPLFRLEVGVPGSSHALDIAGRVGMPSALVARARVLLGERDRRLEDVIESVQVVRREAESDRARAAELSREAALSEDQVRKRLQELEVKQAWLEEEATDFVAGELRAAQTLLEAPLRELANAPRPFGEKARELLDVLGGLLRGSTLHRRRMKFLGTVSKDSVVFLPRLRRQCTVKKVDRVREILTVEFGKLRLEVPFEDVSWLVPLDSP